MKTETRVALARIFSDIIRADNIIDSREIAQFERLRNKYKICASDMNEAMKMSLSQAVDIVKREYNLRSNIRRDCLSIASGDEECDHSEVLLLTAISFALTIQKNVFRHQIISIPDCGANLPAGSIIYVENKKNKNCNAEIENHLRSLKAESTLAGFDFIYIPSIIDTYRNIDPNTLTQVLKFLAPNKSEAVDQIRDNLYNTTTESFCRDILCSKCGFDKSLFKNDPALLIKAGSSLVGRKTESIYLKLCINEDGVAATLRKFIDSIRSFSATTYVRVPHVGSEKQSQFFYFGFYKQLLDMFIIPAEIESDMLLTCHSGCNISFPSVTGLTFETTPARMSLYVLLLMYEDFVDISNAQSAEFQLFKRRYQRLYNFFSAGECPDISSRRNLSPMITHINKSLRELKADLKDVENNYCIIRNGNSIGVNFPLERIHVKMYENSKIVAINSRECEIFKRTMLEIQHN